MITAIVVGVVVGLVIMAVLGLCTGRWGRERLFWVQLAAAVATMFAVGWPLRHRLRAADREHDPFSTPPPPQG